MDNESTRQAEVEDARGKKEGEKATRVRCHENMRMIRARARERQQDAQEQECGHNSLSFFYLLFVFFYLCERVFRRERAEGVTSIVRRSDNAEQRGGAAIEGGGGEYE
jgi:hypothetical protein